MTKAERAAMDKLQEFEVGSAFDKNLLPPQLPRAVGQRLVALGYASEAETILSGRFPVKVHGYVFTTKGHMVYCQMCADEGADIEEEAEI